MVRVRRVREGDRGFVLGYCRDTFGWGDYIGDVWDDWQSDGEFLACEDCAPASTSPQDPVGVCHMYMSPGQAWIEGIRVHPQYRRRGIATFLVREAEKMAIRRLRPPLQQQQQQQQQPQQQQQQQRRPRPPSRDVAGDGGLASAMIIDARNEPSLAMVRLLGYDVVSAWTYHRLPPRRPDSGARRKITILRDIDCAAYPHFVREWRWFETRRLGARGAPSGDPQVVVTARPTRPDSGAPGARGGRTAAVSVLAVGKTVDGPGRTLYATLYPGADPACTDEMIAFLAGAAASESCAAANVFTLGGLPPDCRERPRNFFEFYLVNKRLA